MSGKLISKWFHARQDTLDIDLLKILSTLKGSVKTLKPSKSLVIKTLSTLPMKSHPF